MTEFRTDIEQEDKKQQELFKELAKKNLPLDQYEVEYQRLRERCIATMGQLFNRHGWGKHGYNRR